MGKLFKIFFVLLIAFVATTVLTYAYLGIAGVGVLVVLSVVGFFVLKRVLGKVMKRLFLLPFKAKGSVLKDATAEIHSLSATKAPQKEVRDEDSEEEIAEEQVERNWFLVDVTIRPKDASSPACTKEEEGAENQGCGFRLWEAGELLLVSERKSPEEMLADGDSDESCIIENYKIWDGSAFVEDEEWKHHGEKRLELLIGVLPGVGELMFQYYFEYFGELSLPQPAATLDRHLQAKRDVDDSVTVIDEARA